MAAVRTLKTVVFMGSSRNCVPPCEAAQRRATPVHGPA